MTPRKPYRDFADYLTQRLSDPQEARAFLDLAIEEYEQDGDAEAFLLAVRSVTDAQGGISHLAEETGLNRQTLYRTLSERGNPRLDTLSRILRGLGFRLRVDVATPAAPQ